MPPSQPDEALAREIASATLGEPARSLTRFPTGLQHWVYDAELVSGRKVVVRIASRENRRAFEGALHWYARLRPLGVPLARILHSDVRAPNPFLILECLPGTDLGEVYDVLSPSQRGAIAHAIAGLQERVGRLPEAHGFGYAVDDRTALAADWRSVLRASLDRSRRWLERGSVADPRWADRVESRLSVSGDRFEDVRPRAWTSIRPPTGSPSSASWASGSTGPRPPG